MQLEQQMEQSEQLLETNEQNKRQLEAAQERLRRANNRANVALAQVQRCQNQLQQAVTARNAAAQQTDSDGNRVDTSSYDAAVASAEAELQAANREMHESRRELVEADEHRKTAEGALEQSTRELHGVATELQKVSEKYGVGISRTQELMSMPHSQLASPLLQQLGIGKDRVDDLRRRIAASLGIAMAASSSYGGGGRSARARYLSRGGGDTLRNGSSGGYGGHNTFPNIGGGTASAGKITSISSSYDPTSGFNRINGSHSISSDLKLTNPNYSNSDPNSVWNINCQRCVMAYEARRRGYDVESLPVPSGPDSLPIMRHPDGWPTVFKNPELIDCSANSGTGAKLNVESQMESWGDNCRAIVRVRWKPECGGGGHVFIAERTNGVTRFVDPQNNNEDASDYFMYAKGQDLFCMRTDNLEFSDKIKNCCKNREGLS